MQQFLIFILRFYRLNRSHKIGYFSQSSASVPLIYLFKHKTYQAFIIAKDSHFHRVATIESLIKYVSRTYVKIEERPCLTIEKKKLKKLVLDSHHVFLSVNEFIGTTRKMSVFEVILSSFSRIWTRSPNAG